MWLTTKRMRQILPRAEISGARILFKKKLPELPELVFEGKSPNSPRSRLLKAATTVKCSRLARLLN